MGRFLVIEGLDGAGTTTASHHLVGWLRGRGRVVHHTFEPSDGPVGRLIRQTLARAEGAPSRSTLPWMFAADRADHLARLVGPALAAGDVVCDRYIPSSLAYQSLEVPLALVQSLNAAFRVPDLTLFLRVDVEVALERIAARGAARDIFEQRDFLSAVAARYDEVFALLRAAGQPIVTIDANATLDHVLREVLAAAEAP